MVLKLLPHKLLRLPRTILNYFLRIFITGNITNPVYYLRKVKGLINQNKAYKDKYNGSRCFILGNGPSLKEQDILKLKDEKVFVVNSFPYSDFFENLKPSFFVAMDDIQFQWENPVYGEHRKNLFRKIHNITPECTLIFPALMRDKVKMLNLFSDENCIWAFWKRNWDKYKDNFSFERPLPPPNNVVHLAIMAAIYMGFKEIYLLGVDMTDFLSLYQYSSTNQRELKYGHFYEYKGAEAKLMKSLENYYDSNETRLRIAADKLANFSRINKIAKSLGVLVVNMTKGGGLDVFPRYEFDKWINENINE